ncbi:GSCOCG00012027001-RA-CDS, partial [Cotesia congregata]
FQIGFWNVAGIKNKDEDFWVGLKIWDIKIINKEGRVLCKFVRERGWAILNGCVVGDEEGTWTFIGERGCSVIDLVLIDERGRDKIKGLKIEERTDSDHLPVVVEVETWGKRIKDAGRKSVKVSGRGVWSDEGIKKFQQEFGEGETSGNVAEEIWGDLKGRIKSALTESKK